MVISFPEGVVTTPELKKGTWSTAETAFLRDKATVVPWSTLSEVLNRPEKSIKAKWSQIQYRPVSLKDIQTEYNKLEEYYNDYYLEKN